MASKRILLITNIIGPYRQNLYNAWADDCRRRNIELTSVFMARGQPIRRWIPEDYPLNHPHKFYWGLHIPVPGLKRPIHMNPGIWRKMLQTKWDVIVIGGYDNITSAIACLLPRREGLRVMWSESNKISEGHGGRVSQGIKRMLLRSIDAYAVPGKWAKEYICGILDSPKENPPFISLPNVVRDNHFLLQRNISSEERQRRRKKYGVPDGHRVMLMVGRLDPKKGMDRIIEATGNYIDRPLTYMIAGEGTIQDKIARLAKESGKVNAVLMGYQKEPVIQELLGMTDGFMLASLFDPWPLVMVEAAMAGKPILVSDRVGNWPDIVTPGYNGWLFDVMDPESIRTAVRQFAQADEEELQRMGQNSAALADEKLRTDKVVSHLNDKLLELLEQKKRGETLR